MVGCGCAVCTSTEPHNKRTRTSALLTLTNHAPHPLHMLIDAGPDLRTQALANGITSLDAVLLTHSHYDHVGGLDDLRPFTILSNRVMPLYGTASTLDAVRERYSYAFQPASDGSSRPALELHPVEPYSPFRPGLSPVDVLPLNVIHGTWTITGFRVGNLAYITDASGLPAETRQHLHGLDVLVLNALRHKPHSTHFGLQQALDVVAALQPRRAFFVHMNHDLDHAATCALLPPGVSLAYDGLTVSVPDVEQPGDSADGTASTAARAESSL